MNYTGIAAPLFKCSRQLKRRHKQLVAWLMKGSVCSLPRPISVLCGGNKAETKTHRQNAKKKKKVKWLRPKANSEPTNLLSACQPYLVALFSDANEKAFSYQHERHTPFLFHIGSIYCAAWRGAARISNPMP